MNECLFRQVVVPVLEWKLMSGQKSERQFYAETYDVCVGDWTGEIDFYQEMIKSELKAREGSVLELACGTGRVTIRLAQNNISVVGLDFSPEMLDVARSKGLNNPNIRWIKADMRTFNLAEPFDLILIPSHSFQNLNTPEDQIACLERSYHHLRSGGLLIVHLDHQSAGNYQWLSGISGDKDGVFEEAEKFEHPETQRQIQTRRAWSYELATQTAIVQTIWEEIGEDGTIIGSWDTGPIRLHCVFPFEMEHLLRRAGFDIEQLYGDFLSNELQDDSSEMIWLARKR
jgi:SAM-dependent methyltransferase